MSSTLAVSRRLDRGSLLGPMPQAYVTERYRPYRIPAGTGVVPGQPLYSVWDSDRAVTEGLKSSPMVAVCIGRLAEKGGSVPWYEYRVAKSGTEERMDVAPWIEHPTDHGKITRQFMIELSHHYITLSGNALWGMYWEGGSFKLAPKEVKVENPEGCEPIPDRTRFISAYQWSDTSAGGWRYWDAEDIVHIMGRPDPKRIYWGWSILEALAPTIDGDFYARRMNLARFKRGGYPGVVISEPSIANEDARRTIEDDLNRNAERYMGAYMVLKGTWKLEKQHVLTAEELGIIEAMEFYRDEIALSLGFHPAMFSTDAATDNNMQAAYEQEWQTVVVMNSRIANAINAHPKIIRPSERGRRFIAPDYSGVELLQGIAKKTKTMGELVQQCRVAVNDASRIVGLPMPRQVGGDEPLVQSNLVPASAAAEAIGNQYAEVA